VVVVAAVVVINVAAASRVTEGHIARRGHGLGAAVAAVAAVSVQQLATVVRARVASRGRVVAVVGSLFLKR
jgi:hypothetical protein